MEDVAGLRIERSGQGLEDIGCRALILACNGYGANSELVVTLPLVIS